jgi:hypothetical protein
MNSKIEERLHSDNENEKQLQSLAILGHNQKTKSKNPWVKRKS